MGEVECGRQAPIRLYALANELNIESKDLVDACNKAGIYGKGSPFASLTDDEVVKIKAFLQGASKNVSAKSTDKVVAFYAHMDAPSKRRTPILKLPRLPPPT